MTPLLIAFTPIIVVLAGSFFLGRHLLRTTGKQGVGYTADKLLRSSLRSRSWTDTFPRQATWIPLLVPLFFLSFPECSFAAISDYEGAFRGETSITKSARDPVTCSVTVKRTDSGWAVSGSLAFASGRGAAPDFEGVGYPGKDGSLYFTFTDSFGNKGLGRLFIQEGKTFITTALKSVSDARCAALHRQIEIAKK